LPYTRFCSCLLDYDCVLHIVNFAILYSIKCLKVMEAQTINLALLQIDNDLRVWQALPV
jgi:hypothetical protein